MGDEGELSIQQLGRALPDDWKDDELLVMKRRVYTASRRVYVHSRGLYIARAGEIVKRLAPRQTQLPCLSSPNLRSTTGLHQPRGGGIDGEQRLAHATANADAVTPAARHARLVDVDADERGTRAREAVRVVAHRRDPLPSAALEHHHARAPLERRERTALPPQVSLLLLVVFDLRRARAASRRATPAGRARTLEPP